MNTSIHSFSYIRISEYVYDTSTIHGDTEIHKTESIIWTKKKKPQHRVL